MKAVPPGLQGFRESVRRAELCLYDEVRVSSLVVQNRSAEMSYAPHVATLSNEFEGRNNPGDNTCYIILMRSGRCQLESPKV